MDKSQLRLLALRYANGDLDVLEYLQARSGLVDKIVAGDTLIERTDMPFAPDEPNTSSAEDATAPSVRRDAMPQSSASPAPNPPAAKQENAGAPKPLSKLSIYISAALGVIALVLIGAFFLIRPSTVAPATMTPSAQRTAPLNSPSNTTRPAPLDAAAGRIMETLLMTPRWTNFHLDEFESQWRSLDTAVRRSAKSSAKFRQLSGRISDNLKTHAALVGLDPSSDAHEKWARLKQLGTAIGIETDELPTQAQPTASDPSNARTGAGKYLPTSATPLSDPVLARINASAPPAAGTPGTLTERPTDWFSHQPKTGYTVQLFTASHPNNALRLVEQFPGLRLKVQRSDSTPHLYRVVHGSFVSSEQAEEAGERLPLALTQVTGFPYVRAFDQLKGREIHP